MKLSRDEVVHLSLLCRMTLSEAEVEVFQEQLSEVLDNFEILEEVDTSDVPPTAYPIHLENVVRDDVAAPCMSQDDILANAPHREDGYFRVKPVLE